MTRRRILACAFTCRPPGMPGFSGGEVVLGRNLLKQIARAHESWALTKEEDRPNIEQSLTERPVQDLHFHDVGRAQWMKPMPKIQGGFQLYYYLWQIKAYLEACRLHRRPGFKIVHHITDANDWMASFFGAFLPTPYARGPRGGSHRTPKGLSHEYVLGARFWERVRAAGQWLFHHDPVYLRGQRCAPAPLLSSLDFKSKLRGSGSASPMHFQSAAFPRQTWLGRRPSVHSRSVLRAVS